MKEACDNLRRSNLRREMRDLKTSIFDLVYTSFIDELFLKANPFYSRTKHLFLIFVKRSSFLEH